MSERWPQFDAKRDNELIAAGTHFWCHACQVARLLAEKSLDERYCFRCYAVLMDEAALLPSRGVNRRPAWIPRRDDPTGPTTAPQGRADKVTGELKQADTGKDTPPSFAPMKHAGGRPKKEGEDVSRWTRRRRANETQGELIPASTGEKEQEGALT